MKYPFDEKELQVQQIIHQHTAVLDNDVAIFSFPCSQRENFFSALKDKKPIWMGYNVDAQMVVPRMFPENPARGASGDIPLSLEEKGGKDMFGVEWEFVPAAGGSMVRPGNPLLKDITEWREKVVFPDIDKWDWEGGAKNYEKLYDQNKVRFFTIHNGFWFERLISFLEFENAAISLIDEDYQDDVKALFEKTTELGCRIVDYIFKYFDVDGVFVHDDWGTMRAPFFSHDTAEEMIVPYMKKFTDHVHSYGKIAHLHSCGKIDTMVDCIIDAGWDMWGPMAINDTDMIYEKYGDKIFAPVCVKPYDVKNTTEEEQRALAREFVDRYSVPGKATTFNNYCMEYLTPAFCEEMYKYSRIKFAERD